MALTPKAINRLWTFIANHRSQFKKCQWSAGVIDPKLLLLPEQTAKLLDQSIWFLRIVDVINALERRPYPLNLEVELNLDIKDELLIENSSNFKLQVSGGKGNVSRGGKGDLSLNIRALAPLYTGLFTAQQLQVSGQLEGTEVALQTATQLFTLPTPGLADFF